MDWRRHYSFRVGSAIMAQDFAHEAAQIRCRTVESRAQPTSSALKISFGELPAPVLPVFLLVEQFVAEAR